ncbi:MAG: hypothetical protein WHT64_08795, partial [Desulfomicrobiaceae bacterium]
MRGKLITKHGHMADLRPSETMQLSRLLTPIQREQLLEGESVLVKREYTLDSWKEYWLCSDAQTIRHRRQG